VFVGDIDKMIGSKRFSDKKKWLPCLFALEKGGRMRTFTVCNSSVLLANEMYIKKIVPWNRSQNTTIYFELMKHTVQE